LTHLDKKNKGHKLSPLNEIEQNRRMKLRIYYPVVG
jgi:hypothetical protein